MMKKVFFLFFFLVVQFSNAQEILATENTKVSIITVGTADEAHTFYGHTALRFKDAKAGFDFVFNFGYFNFNTDNFILKFVKGDLQYYVATNSYSNFEYGYKAENRSIYEQELRLTTVEKQKLFALINNTLYSENRFYTYKFIDRNCTTMVIDKINEVLGKKIIQFQAPQKTTYRDVLFPYTHSHFYQQLGINLIFGTKVDQTTATLFLPLDLMQELDKTKVNGKPIVLKKATIFEAQRTSVKSYLDSIYSLVVILFLITFIRKKWLTNVYFFILGSIGVFLCLVGLYSLHEEVLWNYNALLLNPLYLLLLYFLYRKKYKLAKWLVVALYVCLGIYILIMLNKIYFWSVLPIILTNIVLLNRTSYNPYVGKLLSVFYLFKRLKRIKGNI